MDLKQIKTLLEDTFNKELTDGKKRHIVFWYDDEGEFKEDIDELNLENAKILKLTPNNYFFIKYQLEKADTESNYLVYAPFAKPGPRENYLLDILKYSIEFSTDKATVIMRDLNISDDSLKSTFRKYIKFFNNKDRYRTFKEYEIDRYTEETVDVAVLSALCRLPYPDFDEVLRVLLMEEDLESSKYLEAIEKFGRLDVLWKLADKYYGYSDKEPNLEKLAIFMLVTNVAYYLGGELPDTWRKYVSSRKADCVVFLSNFMNHSLYFAAYDRLANSVEGKLKVHEYIDKWEIDDYINCDIFKAFDEEIIKKLKEQLLSDIGEFERYRDIVQARRTKHWYNFFKSEYECIYRAIELFDCWKDASQSIRQYTPLEFAERYADKYYKLDTAYRKFYISFDRLQNKELLMELRDKVENVYVNGYLNTLSIKWSDSLETLNGNWIISGMVMQKDFYNTYIKPFKNRKERVFVIISDALRYEVAREFCDMLNKERKGSTEIFYMQGCIPSGTRLGMASLLPHKSIQIDEDYKVYVDGMSSEGTDNRNKILYNYSQESIAVQFNDVIDMKRDDMRKTFGGKELIYIYHNTIDARGDNSKTEREVFDAVEEAFKELMLLINNLVNNVTATNIIITSDHGFIYKRGNLTESDKISKASVEDAYENRRFVLSTKTLALDGTLTFDMGYLLGQDTDLKCVFPRGVNRFKVQGAGANYVHGGTSLQEILIPVIKFKNDRSKDGKNEVTKVDVKLTSITRKITNTISYLEFFQTEKIEDKRVPLRLKVYFADEDGNRISNENIIIADSRSETYEDRSFREKFVLKNRKYDKTKKYYLIMEDEEETVEKIYEKMPFIIDIAISDDFGF
ncbi:MAG TPA: BREX-1 system phosphatase PglZ type A [Acetivibrio sp.]|uniref:BREX-1 system phosphatase PglZ type A n=1 Tax=Acetivibrio sp. TaxID=1872092 RepID=UPI002C4DDC3B|nr:BREX-1 system phosphatase PglZ type A [Acetivibrio sp.]HOM02046.1 BREX-1 system phosphatase PglZ type A [Acetivibrio sp.]